MRLVFILFVILYVISPIDLIPDMLGPIGRLDDIALIIFAIYQLKKKSVISEEYTDNSSSENNSEEKAKQSRARTTSKRPPHEVLEVSSDASVEEIEKAYKEMARKYHPDRVNHLGAELQAMAHEKMVEITNAYDLLKKRAG